MNYSMKSENKLEGDSNTMKDKHDKENLFYYSTLIGSIEDCIWSIDSQASRHMTGDHKNFSSMKEKETPHKVDLGDKKYYAVKEIGQATIKMELGNYIQLSNVLYVLGLKNNLVSIYFLEEKGYRVAFVDGKFLVWSKYSNIEDAKVIGIHEEILYKLLDHDTQALVHDEINTSELWHRRYAHLHYQAFPSIKQMVVGIP
jgi:hypothetical protein